jgi:hypothetical protein
MAEGWTRVESEDRAGEGWSPHRDQVRPIGRLDASVEYMSFLERGQRLPARLAQVLGVGASTLLGEDKASPDQLLALASSIPDAARPAVIGMLQGVIQAYRKKRR